MDGAIFCNSLAQHNPVFVGDQFQFMGMPGKKNPGIGIIRHGF